MWAVLRRGGTPHEGGRGRILSGVLSIRRNPANRLEQWEPCAQPCLFFVTLLQPVVPTSLRAVASTHLQENPMATLKGSKTEQCLKDAFACEAQANRRYLYFANKADIEGQNDVAALFRSTAEGETGHAMVTWNFWNSPVIPSPACRSVRRATTWPLQPLARRASTPRCTPAWPRPPARSNAVHLSQ